MNHKILHFIKHLFGAIIAALVLLVPSACTTLQAPAPTAQVAMPVPVKNAPATALSTEADSALKAAEQNVIEARIQRSLWIAAVEELEKARAAAKAFDSEATLTHAREVILLCTLSSQQKQAPSVSW